MDQTLLGNEPTLLGSSVAVGGRRLELGFPVKSAFWFRAYLIVMFTADEGSGPNDNVIAYDERGRVAWRIESVTQQRWSPFTSIGEDDDVLLASNLDGSCYEVDPLDGSIIARIAV